jgi:hypothetical protein
MKETINYFAEGDGKKIIEIYKNIKSKKSYLALYSLLFIFLIQQSVAFIYGNGLSELALSISNYFKLSEDDKSLLIAFADFFNNSNGYFIIGGALILFCLFFLDYLDKYYSKSKLDKIFNIYTTPKLKSEYLERKEELEIIEKINSQKILQLYGISGIGKTELSKKISLKLQKENKYKIIWINGDDIKNKDATLSSVHIDTYENSAVNILELIKNEKTILILDNFNNNIKSIMEEFESSNNHESICLITSLSKSLGSKNSHHIGYLPDELSYEILGGKNDITEKIVSYCKGYPLILKHIRNAVDDEFYTWDKILILIQNENISMLEDEREDGSIAKRILSKLLISMKKELEIISIVNSQNIAIEFFEEVMDYKRNNSILKLTKKSIIEKKINYYYIHQIILDAILLMVENPNFENYYSKLKTFLIRGNDIKNIAYYNFIFINSHHLHLTYKKLDYTDELKKILLHTKIQNWDNNKKNWYLDEYNNYDFSPNTKINILLEIEKIEIELFEVRKKFFYSEKEKYIKTSNQKIEVLEERLGTLNKNDNKANYLKHHLGKIYKNIENYDMAIRLFEDVINNDKNANYARLQLARIYTWHRYTEKNKVELDKLLTIILEKEYLWEKESLSTLLATYELISENKLDYYRTKYITNNLDTFFENLFTSLLLGFEQPFQLLSRLAKHLAYLKPEKFKQICEDIPFPDKIESNKNIQYSFAVIQSIYFTILDNDIEKDIKDKAYQNAEQYFKNLKLSDYERGYFIDLYINANEWDSAREVIDTNYKIETPFDYQRLAKIENGKNNFKKAIEFIDLAIEATEVEKNGIQKFIQYKYLMIDEKADILFSKDKIEEAIENLEISIESLIEKDEDIFKELQFKLDKWKSL